MKKTVCTLLIIIAIASITGCTSKLKVDEDAVKDVSDKITEAIINTVGKEAAESQKSHTINAADLDTLNIKSTVGDINITSVESEEAVININIVANSSSKEKSQQLIENFTYTAQKQLNSIVIDTSNKSMENIDDSSIKTELDISVPLNIDNIVISLNVGDINLKNINGKFEIVDNVGDMTVENCDGYYNLKSDVGEIVLINSAAKGKSEFNTNTGDINVVFADIANADSITAKTGVGDIKMSLPENSSYEAVIHEFMEDEKAENMGDGSTKIELKTGVGSIDFK